MLYKKKCDEHLTSCRYNHTPLLPSDPGGLMGADICKTRHGCKGNTFF